MFENIRTMTIDQVEARWAEIRQELEQDGADIEALSAEIDALEARRNEIRSTAEARAALAARIAAGTTGSSARQVAAGENRGAAPCTNDEVRASQAYINAFVRYLKTGRDEECRALLTELVGGTVPVPTIVEERVRTAWDRLGIMSLVRKTRIRGILRIGFEVSATGAVNHTEGSAAPSDETLTLGVVTLTPVSVKKWIKISDEAMDLGGEEFLNYVYDELAYRIAKQAQANLITAIVACTASATSTAVGVGVVTGSPSVGIVADALGELSDDAADAVIIMNKKSFPKFKSAQYANKFNVDPFESLNVLYDNSLPVYTTAGTTGAAWAIVGDFGVGAQANLPNGDEVTIKYDDITLSEDDLVKIVGREYIAVGAVADKAFAKIVF